MLRHVIRFVLPVFAALTLLLTAASISAGAEETTVWRPFRDRESSVGEDVNEPTYETISTEPYTEPYTEPHTEPEPTEPYTEPVWTEEPTEYYEPETESPRDEYAQLIEDAEEPTGINSVKMDKSVSNKGYATDYTAGIVSWFCVGVGVVVVLVMLISTKLGGRGGAAGA